MKKFVCKNDCETCEYFGLNCELPSEMEAAGVCPITSSLVDESYCEDCKWATWELGEDCALARPPKALPM